MTFAPGSRLGSNEITAKLLDPRAIPTQINVVLNSFEELKVKVPAR